MPQSRRAFIKGGGLAVLAAGSGLHAGCTSVPLGETASYREEAFETWFFDPTAYTNTNNEIYASIDVTSIYDNREHLPPSLFEEIDEFDREVASIEVSEFQHASGLAYFNFDNQQDMSGGLMTIAAGSFDPEDLQWELRQYGDQELIDYGEYERFELIGTEEELDDGTTQSSAIGVNEETVVLGFTYRSRLNARRSVEAAIDANRGNEERYVETNRNAELLTEELRDSTWQVGVDFDQRLINEFRQGGTQTREEETIQRLINDMDAIGMGSTVDGDTTTNQVLLVYEDAEAASADYLDRLINMIREDHERNELLDYVDEIEISEDGRVVRLYTEIETVELWQESQLSEEISNEEGSEDTFRDE